jgi:uncharacterized protein YacL
MPNTIGVVSLILMGTALYTYIVKKRKDHVKKLNHYEAERTIEIMKERESNSKIDANRIRDKSNIVNKRVDESVRRSFLSYSF